MNDSILKRVLEKSIMLELAECENTPEHKFSLKHRLAMKRIFTKYERNVRKLRETERPDSSVISEQKTRLNFKQRLLIATVIIILMTFLVGWVVVFVSEKFHGTVYRDNTLLTAVDVENCPKTIEYRYTLASVPDGFEIIETNSSRIDVYTLYLNKTTNQTITLYQTVKTNFSPRYNTEHYHLEEVDVNGDTVLCIDLSDKTCNQTLVVWDNGDYIIEIIADLTKFDTINLSNVTKL